MQTITSPNNTINTVPPILTAPINNATNSNVMNNKISNNIIFLPPLPFYKGACIFREQRKKVKGPKPNYLLSNLSNLLFISSICLA